MPTLSSLAIKIIAVVAIVLVLVVAVKSCTGSRQKAAQAQQEARSSQATAATAIDSAKTVIATEGAKATTDELVRETVKEMDDVKDPEAAALAARLAICELMPNRCPGTAR